MELHFLGRGAGFYTAEGNTAAYAIEGDKLLLLDCGETVFSRLQALNLLDNKQQVYVLVSHLHFDHIGSLGSLVLYCYHALHIKLQLVLPEDGRYRESLRTLLTMTGNPPSIYGIVPPNALAGLFGIAQMHYVPTTHAPNMQCFSFVFDTMAGRIFYSADTAVTDHLASFLKEHTDFQRVYIDTTDADYPGKVHVSLRELAQLVPKEKRAKVTLMHVNSESCIRKGLEMGFSTVCVQKDEHSL